MKYVKLFGLLAATAATLMAFADAAAATTITSPTGTATTPSIHAVSEGHIVLSNNIAAIECSSTVAATVTAHGSGSTAAAPISKLEFTGCTNSWIVQVQSNGTLEVHWTGGYNGTLTSNGTLVHTTRFMVPCNYETKTTDIGTVTGGNPATLDIAASIPIAAGSSELCGSGNAKWLGSYATTSSLYIDQ